MYEMLIMLVGFGAIMYFMMIRPQQKRMREQQATIEALQPGDRILLTSGVFATIRHLGKTQAIVELAPGAEVTILKGNIARPVTADEEEFEFSDEAEVAEPTQDFDAVVIPDNAAALSNESAEFDPRPESVATATETSNTNAPSDATTQFDAAQDRPTIADNPSKPTL